MTRIQLINASAQRIPLPGGCVHTVVTSPPYWGLRAYAGEQQQEWETVTYIPMAGLPPITVPGCDPRCNHEWAAEQRKHPQDRDGHYGAKQETNRGAGRMNDGAGTGSWCQNCGGWRGGLGLEPTPEMFVAHIVFIWREIWRVLRKDGTCWLNFGDSYNGSQKGYQGEGEWADRTGVKQGTNAGSLGLMPTDAPGLKPKDLVGIPWRVAFALQADGWYLRSDIIWHKPNPMPESVTDRPTKAHEYLFLLAKRPTYYYDAEAIKEPQSPGTFERYKPGEQIPSYNKVGGSDRKKESFTSATTLAILPAGRNRRSVWTINTAPYAGAHFATFPPDLVEPCIKAGTSEYGVCSVCGAPWERVAERNEPSPVMPDGAWEADALEMGVIGTDYRGGRRLVGLNRKSPEEKNPGYTTLGWQPTCTCHAGEALKADDLEIINTPTGKRVADDPSLVTGRAGYNRPRGDDEGQRPITRYEQRKYAEQLKASPHKEAMVAEVGETTFAHYIRTDRSGARPVPSETLDAWIERGWLEQVTVPTAEPLPPVPATVLDPFAGSGTTGQVARSLSRDAILLDISQPYLAEQANTRLDLDRLAAWQQGIGIKGGDKPLDDLPLFAPKE
jgi:DNA modification methylase